MPRPGKRGADAAPAITIPPEPLDLQNAGPFPQDVIYEGWLLKKRRKKMQGYGRRYFVLRTSGLLEYAFEPNTTVRDQIYIPQAAISSTTGRHDIHIDSEHATFHMKCLTRQDFDHWMGALRKFTVTEAEHHHGGRSSMARMTNNQTSLIDNAVVLLGEMGTTIESLSETFAVLEHDDKRKHDHRHHWRKEKKENHHREGSSVFGLFKKAHSTNHDDPTGTHEPPITASDRMYKLLEALQTQHDALHNSLSNLSSLYTTSSKHGSPLPSIADEGGITPTKSTPPSTWHPVPISKRTSLSSRTDSESVWFDALEGDDVGAEEFILEPQDMGETESSLNNATEMGSQTSVDINSSLGEDDESLTSHEEEPLQLHVSRRTQLPARPSGDEGSLFSILKKSVGQDLANISFPVVFNEPLTLLQRSAEELEYHDLLDQAAANTDWIARISFVAAFAVSGYACTKHRSGKKGFTPMLGETFEDFRTKFIAEKIVHKPLLIAYHAEGTGWELNATSSGKTKFWGKSLEIIPTGTNVLKIGEDVFEWRKPSSFTRNLMMGTKYLEHCGEMVITNETTGATCVLNFKETGYWASTPNAVSGTVVSPDGDVVSQLEGKWDEQFSQKLNTDHLRILWRISAFPRNASEYYGYTYFGITLNEITLDIKDKLPPSDSRFRPDVRALEEGDVPRAEAEKLRCEEKQRERRESGQAPAPRWFKQVDDSDRWIYVGGYWEERARGWKNTPHISLW